MRNDKILAYKMRMRGQSYAEISEGLGMPKSTLSTWFRHLVIPKEAQEKIVNRSRAASMNALLKVNHERSKRAEISKKSLREASQKELRKLSGRDLMIAGVTLYWTEGYKSPIIRNGMARTYHPVSFTSADPQKIILFLEFLRTVCDVPDHKILADLRRKDPKQDPKLLEFWSKTTGLPFANFKKIYKGKEGPAYGTIQIRVNSTPLFHKIMGWIEGLQNS